MEYIKREETEWRRRVAYAISQIRPQNTPDLNWHLAGEFAVQMPGRVRGFVWDSQVHTAVLEFVQWWERVADYAYRHQTGDQPRDWAEAVRNVLRPISVIRWAA